ncbi:hypothetical protein FY034_08170 [Trichlorobacter lovleyi]|uniref:hypothetical protein n=1 Tax=Trichlorobacter lovleyi TaxID=313985 RepID=UPI00223EB9A5|nr:hypothetical protein [Trichlorobacter lovleyi]QOX78909.1 hypothetical protein FY034_08170 [Trichlorobacter lovleyi]
MSEQPFLRDCALANGLQVTVADVSRHYYGGYWQVCLEVSCLVPLELGLFSDPVIEADACRLLGAAVPFVRHLEKMAVHGDDLAAVQQELLERFDRHLLPFLGNQQFPSRFIQSEFQKRCKKSNRGIPCLL